MVMTRREALRKLTAGTVSVVATGAATGVALSGVAHSEETPAVPPDAVGLLYDATRCVGCQSCVAACAQANNQATNATSERLYQIAYDLNSTTRNIIKLYRPTAGQSYSYVKQQCMHCVDPACVAGCMFKGLKKDPKTGVVSWNSKLCVGCRYCEIACPYHIPKFQWQGYNPKIVKCELCKERLARGEQPACSSVCPVHAVIFGKRDELLAEAKRRIQESPGKYFQDRVYGEHEAGGTQCLYLSHVPFSNLGLADLPDESVPQKYLKWQKRVYSYLAVPAVVYASVVGVITSSFKEHKAHMEEEEKETGLRPQL